MASSASLHQESSVPPVTPAVEEALVGDADIIGEDVAENNELQHQEFSPDIPEASIDLTSLTEITDIWTLDAGEPHVEIDRTQRPSWLEEPLQTTPADTPAHLFEGPAVKLFLGKERKEYEMPRALISYYSGAFRCLEQETAPSTISDSEVHEFVFVDVKNIDAFEVLQNWMETRKVDVQIRGLGLTVQQIMTRFLSVFVLGERLSMMEPIRHGCNIYAAVRSHILKLCEVNGDSMDLNFVGLASEGLPKDHSLVLDIVHTVCRNVGNRLSKQDKELALTSLFSNHPGLLQFFALKNIDFDLNLLFTEEEQIERAINCSLVDSSTAML